MKIKSLQWKLKEGLEVTENENVHNFIVNVYARGIIQCAIYLSFIISIFSFSRNLNYPRKFSTLLFVSLLFHLMHHKMHTSLLFYIYLLATLLLTINITMRLVEIYHRYYCQMDII